MFSDILEMLFKKKYTKFIVKYNDRSQFAIMET